MGNPVDDMIEKSLDDNTLAVLADGAGVRVLGKIRGLTPEQLGRMFGRVQGALWRQIGFVGSHLRQTVGDVEAAKFTEALARGRQERPQDERVEVSEVPQSAGGGE